MRDLPVAVRRDPWWRLTSVITIVYASSASSRSLTPRTVRNASGSPQNIDMRARWRGPRRRRPTGPESFDSDHATAGRLTDVLAQHPIAFGSSVLGTCVIGCPCPSDTKAPEFGPS
jgi:hypothetical protein